MGVLIILGAGIAIPALILLLTRNYCLKPFISASASLILLISITLSTVLLVFTAGRPQELKQETLDLRELRTLVSAAKQDEATHVLYLLAEDMRAYNNTIKEHQEKTKNIWIGIFYSSEIAELEPIPEDWFQ